MTVHQFITTIHNCEINYGVCVLDHLTGNREKVSHLWRLPSAKERLQLVRADLMEEGSFDDAVMACEGVFHTASPVLAKSDSNCKA
jgi:hypothetical protein